MKREIPSEYNPLEAESRWQEFWRKNGLGAFKRDDRTSQTYVIDTPPPYPSGEFHMGTALNWTYFDIVARYKRMRGFNVFFPQGWDCHGLPTEVQVERRYGIRKGDLPPSKFRELCVNLTQENIAHMKEEMNLMGFSIDWSTEYRTMDPDYYRRTQLSFVRLYKKGMIYRGEHPVNWCPRCETAIADAEVEHGERKTVLSYIKFKLVDGEEHLTIATTRPEYLPACVVVAVHPSDERYRKYVGERLEVPLFKQVVGIIEDEEVDPNFGTGVVMVCTFGDRTDVRWVKKHKLPVVKLIDGRGRLTESAGKYSGMTLEDARKAILNDLSSAGLLVKQDDIEQSVGFCWRCKTPVEIMSVPQWFMKVLDLKERVLEEAEKVRWVPEHMKTRFVDWVNSMDWDWVISRQRIFATPIPVWYCSGCGEPVVAKEEQLPVIPEKDSPPVKKCEKCGGEKFEPEKDVLDTWMDSSITIAVHAGWPDMDERLFPADLQPNGTDIIRTWDYYLMVRHLALLERSPYRSVLINGMVLGTDGRAMHKSLGNYVDTGMAREKYGADALRQWAAIGASTGSDIPFSWKDVEFGYRFMRKLWNAARFCGPHLEFSTDEPDIKKFRPMDRWMLSRLTKLITRVTQYMEDFQFNMALGAIHNFVWHEFCDNYLEAVKHRLYGNDRSTEGARFTLSRVLFDVTRLLAPFIPHFSEELYQIYFVDHIKVTSVHMLDWPKPEVRMFDEGAEREGEIANALIGALRQFKSSRKLPLNMELERVDVHAGDDGIADIIRAVADDVKGTVRIRDMKVTTKAPEVEERVKGIILDPARLGPRLRGDFKAVAAELEKIDPGEIAKSLARGTFSVKVSGRDVEINAEDVKIVREIMVKGKKVESITLDSPPVTILIRADQGD
ncbi:MAG: valine--tRNA ligase [Candidatus Hadarchaeales archaeon]